PGSLLPAERRSHFPPAAPRAWRGRAPVGAALPRDLREGTRESDPRNVERVARAPPAPPLAGERSRAGARDGPRGGTGRRRRGDRARGVRARTRGDARLGRPAHAP